MAKFKVTTDQGTFIVETQDPAPPPQQATHATNASVLTGDAQAAIPSPKVPNPKKGEDYSFSGVQPLGTGAALGIGQGLNSATQAILSGTAGKFLMKLGTSLAAGEGARRGSRSLGAPESIADIIGGLAAVGTAYGESKLIDFIKSVPKNATTSKYDFLQWLTSKGTPEAQVALQGTNTNQGVQPRPGTTPIPRSGTVPSPPAAPPQPIPGTNGPNVSPTPGITPIERSGTIPPGPPIAIPGTNGPNVNPSPGPSIPRSGTVPGSTATPFTPIPGGYTLPSSGTTVIPSSLPSEAPASTEPQPERFYKSPGAGETPGQSAHNTARSNWSRSMARELHAQGISSGDLPHNGGSFSVDDLDRIADEAGHGPYSARSPETLSKLNEALDSRWKARPGGSPPAPAENPITEGNLIPPTTATPSSPIPEAPAMKKPTKVSKKVPVPEVPVASKASASLPEEMSVAPKSGLVYTGPSGSESGKHVLMNSKTFETKLVDEAGLKAEFGKP